MKLTDSQRKKVLQSMLDWCYAEAHAGRDGVHVSRMFELMVRIRMKSITEADEQKIKEFLEKP